MHFLDFLNFFPIWVTGLFLFIFCILDMTIATVRTITIVQGMRMVSVILGFFEIMIWAIAMSQMLLKIESHPLFIIIYAAGFSIGSGIGICIEEKLALGEIGVRIVSSHGNKVIEILKQKQCKAISLTGQGIRGDETIIFSVCFRRDLRKIINEVKAVDPDMFYLVEQMRESSFRKKIN